MELLLIVVGAGVAFWCVLALKKRRQPASLPRSDARTQTAPHPTVLEVGVRWAQLPDGVEAQIVAALQRGGDPGEEWITATMPKNDGRIRMAPYSARFQSVAGESFNNPDGKPRRKILKDAEIGGRVFLVAEPTNRYDPDAVGVFLDKGGGDTAQIGYLPRGEGFGYDTTSGHVAAWLARVQAPEHGAPLGAVLYLVLKDA
ncbi:MAG: HIRAN domain-containing protein [Verrucomicrobiota bacterium]